VIQAFCDGSITGGHWAKADNRDSLPHAWSGWWVRDKNGHVLQWRSVDLGEGDYMSANVAEYFAVRSALNWIKRSVWKNQEIEVLSDSQTVIRQLEGRYNCYDQKLMLLRDDVRSLAQWMNVRYTWIRREQNREADVLSKALQIWGRQPTWEEVEARLTGPKKRKKKAA